MFLTERYVPGLHHFPIRVHNVSLRGADEGAVRAQRQRQQLGTTPEQLNRGRF